ncbi:hypothetical protein Tco_0397204 [Tanacetum coccineum]
MAKLIVPTLAFVAILLCTSVSAYKTITTTINEVVECVKYTEEVLLGSEVVDEWLSQCNEGAEEGVERECTCEAVDDDKSLLRIRKNLGDSGLSRCYQVTQACTVQA